jgi:hypothetical protein
MIEKQKLIDKLLQDLSKLQEETHQQFSKNINNDNVENCLGKMDVINKIYGLLQQEQQNIF